MSYYVIGIGGTGAKCVEALTHLCAAGLMPDDGELYAVFVDPDRSNGSLERAEITLQQYTNCKKLQLGSTDLFKTNIAIAKPNVWSPFGNEPQPRLDKFFQYNVLKANNPAAAHLFDVLYSPDEKTTPLQEGFRGHPSIGAAVMATTLQLGAGEPWKTFRDKIAEDVKNGAGAKIILIGSIFGGTGASGIPTIARLIREELKKIGQQNASLGGVMMLPYFSFTPVNRENLRADAENFLLSTQAALKYYYQQASLSYYDEEEDQEHKVYDGVYLLGEESLSPVKDPSIGGRTQRNEPHFIELYAALACVDFFSKTDSSGYMMSARHEANRVTWKDLPYTEGAEVLRQKFDQLTRFAFAYLCSYYPALEQVNVRAGGYRAPWYIDFFEREKVVLSRVMQTELPQVKEYCEAFLRWVADIQTSAKELRVELSNYNAYAEKVRVNGDKESVELLKPGEFKTAYFDNLTLPNAEADANALSRLWESMCDATVKDNHANGSGKFIHALYRECGE
jgi:tubulin-like protein